jgi:polyisoprenoid-binding protein YceI
MKPCTNLNPNRIFTLAAAAGLMLASCKPAPPPPPALPTTAATNAVAAPAAQPKAAGEIAPSGPPVRHVSTVGCKARIDGTATGKTWSMEGSVISGYFEANAADLFKGQAGKLAAKAEIKIPVRSLKSGKTTMDERMQKDMNMDDFPMIGFVLEELVLSQGAAGGPVQGVAKGALAISGVTNKISLPVTFTRTGQDTFKADASADLKMTAFKIVPPKFSILGTEILETGDDVKVTLEWLLKAKP